MVILGICSFILKSLKAVVATGYGRVNVSFATKNITEISCHAKGVLEAFPNIRTIIDMGGQDCKVIKIDDMKKPIDFLMNDKCAAGTGRFLEVMAKVLEIDISHFGEIFLSTSKSVDITSTCTVFAELLLSRISASVETEPKSIPHVIIIFLLCFEKKLYFY